MLEQIVNNNSVKPIVLLTDIDNTLYDFVDFYARAFRSMVHLLASDLGSSEDDLIDDFKRLFQERGSVDQSYLIENLQIVKALPADRVHLLTARGRRAFDLTRQKHLRPYAEIPFVLKTLRDAGVKIIAVTNAPYHYAYTRMRSIGVLDFFFGLIAWEGSEAPNEIAARNYTKIRDQAGRRLRCFRTFTKQMSKPNSLPFELARDYCGVRAEYYALGDSVAKDLMPASVLGAKMIWAKYGTVVDEKNLATIIRITPWSAEDIRLHSEEGKATPDFIVNEPKELLQIIPQRQMPTQQLSFL